MFRSLRLAQQSFVAALRWWNRKVFYPREDAPRNEVTTVLIFFALHVFLLVAVLVVPQVARHHPPTKGTDDDNNNNGRGRAELLWWYCVYFAPWWFVCSVVYHRLTKSNPGFLDASNVTQYEKVLTFSDKGRPAADFMNRNIDLEQGMEFIEKYPMFCEPCGIEQPLRSRHCHHCKKCVARFDHHCFWIANCVGQNNQRLFCVFLAMESILLAMSMNEAWFALHRSWGWAGWSFLVFCTLMNCAFLGMTFGLFLYQCFLVMTNQTSWEHNSHRTGYLKNVPEGVLPFHHGVLNNCRLFWLHNLSPIEQYMVAHRDPKTGQTRTNCLADCC